MLLCGWDSGPLGEKCWVTAHELRMGAVGEGVSTELWRL